MTRTLTDSTTTQKNANSSSPYCLAKVELGGAVGTKWLADRDIGNAGASSYDNAEGRILHWGALRSRLSEDARYNPVGGTTIVLSDHDAAWHGYYDSLEFQRKTVTIYQHFVGLAEADLTVIFKGIITDAPQWSDDGRRMTLRLTDYSTKYRKTVGTICDRANFSNVSDEDEDSVLPIVFGSQKRSKCVAVDIGPICRLVKRCGWADTKLYVDNAEDFPQNTAITIRIHNEIIEGSFAGNTFTATSRTADLVTD